MYDMSPYLLVGTCVGIYVCKYGVNTWLFQVGFNPLRVLRKRNKALRKIKKQLQQKDDDITEVRHKTATNSR